MSSINALKDQFYLQEGLTFLNFGSFGACPRPIMQRYQALQIEMERDPVAFIVEKGIKYLADSRSVLGKYIGCDSEDLVYIPNPTYAVNLIAKNLDLRPNDEILSTNIEYGACDRTWEYYCKKIGAKYIRKKIDLPLNNADLFVANFMQGVNHRTRLIFLSHITSSTALILPVEKIIHEAKLRGIPVFIDGAHVPGHIPLNITALDPEYYTGACHKWMMTPKGSSFLYVKKGLQYQLDPLIISWGYNSLFPSSSQFLDYHQMNGTRDYTAYLTIPEAVQFMKENQWSEQAKICRKLCHENVAELCSILHAKPLTDNNEIFTGQMYSAEIRTNDPEKLHDNLLHRFQIQIPVMRQDDKIYLRYSINVFNSQKDLNHLFEAIHLLKKQKLIE